MNWNRKEQWIILFCALVVLIMVIAAIGYLAGGWEEIP